MKTPVRGARLLAETPGELPGRALPNRMVSPHAQGATTRLLLNSIFRSSTPVWEPGVSATVSGALSAMTRPPAAPPSGP
jgi:hypothetical protein